MFAPAAVSTGQAIHRRMDTWRVDVPQQLRVDVPDSQRAAACIWGTTWATPQPFCRAVACTRRRSSANSSGIEDSAQSTCARTGLTGGGPTTPRTLSFAFLIFAFSSPQLGRLLTGAPLPLGDRANRLSASSEVSCSRKRLST